MLIGEVLHVDGFGNIITNFGEKEVELMKIKHIVNVKLRNARVNYLSTSREASSVR